MTLHRNIDLDAPQVGRHPEGVTRKAAQKKGPKEPAVAQAQPSDATPKRALRARGLARRERIMDAAEEVFSERGYYGSSLREVSARSAAAIGLINHYFPSKEELFNAVVDRKRDVLAAAVRSSLDRVPPHSSGSPRAVVEHFITPFLRACVEQANDLHRYVQMTSHFMSTYRVPEIRPALESLKPISDIFRERLRSELGDVPDRDFKIAVYLIEAALIFMVQDTGFLETVSDGSCVAERIDELIRPAATFFAGGTAALTEKPSD